MQALDLVARCDRKMDYLRRIKIYNSNILGLDSCDGRHMFSH